MKLRKFLGAVLAAAFAVGMFIFPVENNGGELTVYADEDGFIIKTDSDGDSYISGYEGDGGDITIPSGVTWIGNKAFFGNKDITGVTFPESCWYWVDKQAFAFCPNLKTVTFSGSIGGIGDAAFFACTSLQTVTFGGSVGNADSDGGIGSYAFSNCTSLKTVDFADSEASLDMLGGCAFSECIRLSSINLPAGTGTLYNDVFVNCSALESLEIPASAEIVGSHVFGYMYGSTSKTGVGRYVRASGNSKLYISVWNEEDGNYSEMIGTITQNGGTITAVRNTDGARFAEDNGIYCNYAAAASGKDLPAPDKVNVSKSSGKIVLKWNTVDGADGYRVYMYDSESEKYKEYKSVRTEQCTVEDVESGEKYRFIIASLDYIDGEYVSGKHSRSFTVTAE